jgi:rRNA maturation RNase YbeY
VPVLLQNQQRAVPVDCVRLKRTASAILASARTGEAELSLVLVSDRRMRALNRRYRKKDRATDVLAFSQCEGRFSRFHGRLLGDVVISVPTAKRQAAEHGHGLYEEMSRLLVHGVLHLLGYDHERGPREAARMARKERTILRAIRSS